jgi:hypothetical protein
MEQWNGHFMRRWIGCLGVISVQITKIILSLPSKPWNFLLFFMDTNWKHPLPNVTRLFNPYVI